MGSCKALRSVCGCCCLNFGGIGLNVPIGQPFLKKDEVALKSDIFEDDEIG